MRNRPQLRLAYVLAPTILISFSLILEAGSGGRSGESIAATGTFAIHKTPDMKQVPLDASYLLDFRSAKLFATTPELSKNSARLVSEMSVRDLIVDFNLEPGLVPHFMMNSASLGALGGGTSALLVIETTTKQVALYWSYPNPKTSGLSTKPEFELVQVRPYATRTHGTSPLESISVSGPITLQMTKDLTQVTLDAVYWLESNAEGSMLFTMIPEIRKTVAGNRSVGEVATRDLSTDFKLKSGITPHFLVTTPSLGAPAMGMAALFVMETTTKQLGIYRTTPRATVQGSKPSIELLEVRTYEEPQLPALPQTN